MDWSKESRVKVNVPHLETTSSNLFEGRDFHFQDHAHCYELPPNANARKLPQDNEPDTTRLECEHSTTLNLELSKETTNRIWNEGGLPQEGGLCVV